MKTIKEINKSKIPVVRIDASLDKYDGVVLFPEKVASANEMLRTVGLPRTNKKTSQSLIVAVLMISGRFNSSCPI